MDWDIPSYIFSECVTIDVGTSCSVDVVSNDGFASTNPLTFAPGGTASSYDIGPKDHGALFQFLFKKPDDGVTGEWSGVFTVRERGRKRCDWHWYR
jgi:hypothetical protein